jgi:hypothetical protein
LFVPLFFFTLLFVGSFDEETSFSSGDSNGSNGDSMNSGGSDESHSRY